MVRNCGQFVGQSEIVSNYICNCKMQNAIRNQNHFQCYNLISIVDDYWGKQGQSS